MKQLWPLTMDILHSEYRRATHLQSIENLPFLRRLQSYTGIALPQNIDQLQTIGRAKTCQNMLCGNVSIPIQCLHPTPILSDPGPYLASLVPHLPPP
jgi:hypothetical protein